MFRLGSTSNNYLQKMGSRKCPHQWASQLAGKLIEIVYGMWNHRSEVLHKQENSINKRKHKEQNERRQQIYEDLVLSMMRLLTAAERRFFNTQEYKKCKTRISIRKNNG